jgi:hypothetical protein
MNIITSLQTVDVFMTKRMAVTVWRDAFIMTMPLLEFLAGASSNLPVVLPLV